MKGFLKKIENNLIKVSKPTFINAGQMFSNLPNTFEVIRKDLWSIEFPIDMNIPETLQVSASRPKINNPRKEVQYKNLVTYYKGKTDQDELNVVFRDAIGPAIYQKLLQWQRQHTDYATGKGGYAATYKKTLILNMEDPAGGVIQRFRYFGCFITSIDGGDLDMTSDDIANISLTISWDSVEQDF